MEQKKELDRIEKNETGKKFNGKTVLLAGVLLIVALSLLLIGSIYFFSPKSDSFPGRIIGRFSYPVAVVENTGFIYSSMLQGNLFAIRNFYENQDFSKVGARVDFSTEDGQKRLKIKEKEILNKAVEDKAVEILAKRRGITVTTEDVDRIVAQQLKQYGSADEAEGNLEKIYGWKLEQFKVAIVMPMLYAEKLEQAVAEEISSSSGAREVIEKAKQELDGGKDFAEVARSYSQGVSSQEGGDLGWIAKDQLLPEIAGKIFDVDPSSQGKSEVIESRLGFHIVKVEENKKESGVDMVRIRQIFVGKMTFGDWLGEQMKDMDVKILLKDYFWNGQEAVVEFRDEQMKNFEKETYENPEGDISVMF